ncbi:MAG: 30S ribosomal protein S5 [Candidatus Pacebacteria bacterium]|nr:30S ribosomal protein S5 [Candidatus Paceibacterota bacterium]
MSETKQQEAKTDEVKTSSPAASATADTARASQVTKAATDAPAAGTPGRRPRPSGPRGGDRNQRRNPRRNRRGGRRDDRARSEFDQKIIGIRRVVRVMAGGRRFSFSVSMVIGNKKGKVGVGVGKAGDTQLAIEKAARNAKKNLIEVPMNKDNHIPHDAHVKYASSEVMLMPAPGRGLVAGSSVRTVLELAGVKDVTAKIFSRSKNKLNNARAAVEALKQLKK